MGTTTTPTAPRWNSPPAEPRLKAGEVHVWRIPLDPPPAKLAVLASHLHPEERGRAARFRFERDRDRYTAGRGRLREILGTYLGEVPAAIRLDYGEQGKPRLGAEHPAAFRFNLSHSGPQALLAVARSVEVGVDLELIRPEVAAERIACRFFAPKESAALAGLSGVDLAVAFFACWTRKEAYIKARGGGLFIDLSSFEVSVLPGDPAALLATYADPTERDRWRLVDLPVGPGYAAALARESSPGHPESLCCWEG